MFPGAAVNLFGAQEVKQAGARRWSSWQSPAGRTESSVDDAGQIGTLDEQLSLLGHVDEVVKLLPGV